VKHLEVSFFGFYLLPATFTLWAFNPFFPQGKVQPLNIWPTQCLDECNGVDEWEKDGKWQVWWEWTMASHESPQWQLKTYGHKLARASCHSPLDMFKWISIRSKHPLETKELNAHTQRFWGLVWHIPWYPDSLPRGARTIFDIGPSRGDGCCCYWQGGGDEENKRWALQGHA